MAIVIKRVYDPPLQDDGYRVLVDRLWPRGLSKAQAKIDLWLKDAAPSAELRRWFNHDPTKWREFKRRYFAELKQHADLTSQLKMKAESNRVTLLYGAKDTVHNNALALKEYLKTH
jgi:uncharacterized protein YeaO (DUF488 family)